MPPAAGYPNLDFQQPSNAQWRADFPNAFGGGGGRGSARAVAPPPLGRGAPAQFLGDANRMGLFNPLGPGDAFFDPIRSEQVAGSQARNRKALLAAKLFGRGDPSQMGFASLQSTLGESGNLARILGAARAQQSGESLNFYRDLLRDFSGVSNRGGFQK